MITEKRGCYYDILPCPFCGGRPYLETSHRAFVNAVTTKVAFVRCTECNARSGRVKLSDYECTGFSHSANLEAVEMWNRRTKDEGLQGHG